LLKIDYPIIQAGMANVAGPELAAAVSNAAGFGILTATMVAPDVLREEIHRSARQIFMARINLTHSCRT
jgi:NAD(P)H-dependent flavin oxidoreductase YrpB (nitropropane dioxygenase family)